MYDYDRFLVQNGKVSLHTTVYPREHAETVVLLHGGPGVPDSMFELAAELHRKFQVINFEQRGTGLSSNPDSCYTIEDYISDIDAIAAHFQLEDFHLFGHSWGGLYAQIYSAERPSRIKSLFLCSPSSGTNELWKCTEREVMHFNKKMASNWEWMKMGWYSLLGMFGSDRAYQKLFFLVMSNYHKEYPNISVNEEQLKSIKAAPINKTRASIVRYKPLEKMSATPFKVCLTYGSQDIYGKSQQAVSERYPSTTSIIIDGSGHIPWLHQPSAFGKILQEFYALGHFRNEG